MLKQAAMILGWAMALASCGGSGGNKAKYAAYDAKVQTLMGAKQVPLDAQIEGVWNDASESAIALVHREGDELRVLVALGDMRSNIPLTSFEVTDMGNHLPGPAERARAAEALKTWRDGSATPHDRFLFALAGKNDAAGKSAAGSWNEGNAPCASGVWGSFVFEQRADKNGAPVLMIHIYATKQKWGDAGGEDFEFARTVYLEKSTKPIPPSILENLKKTENFCRKTAE